MVEVQHHLRELLRLQRLREEIIQAEEAIKKIDLERKITEKKQQELIRARQEIEDSIKELNAELRKIEFKRIELEDKLKKTKSKERFVRRAEEFRALVKERAKIEEMVIELRSQKDYLNAVIEDLAKSEKLKAFKNEIQELSFELKEIEESKKKVSERLDIKIKEWQETCLKVPKDVLEDFKKFEKEVGIPFLLRVGPYFDCERCGTVLASSQHMRVIKGFIVKCQGCGVYLYHDKGDF